MATQFDLFTSADDQQIVSAFDRAFYERPSFMDGLKSWGRKTSLQRSLKWRAVATTDPWAVREYELETAGHAERMMTEKVGSISGSRMALVLNPPGPGPRASIYTPKFKTAWGGMLNQFSGEFKVFSKIVVDNLKEVDPSVYMEKG